MCGQRSGFEQTQTNLRRMWRPISLARWVCLFVIFLAMLYSFQLIHSETSSTKQQHQLATSQRKGRRCKLMEKESSQNYSKFMRQDLAPNKYVIYTCTGASRGSRCGGWSDRMKTIVSSYILSLITKRQFRIMDTYPCNFNKSFDENLITWKLKQSELKDLTSQNFYASSGVKIARNHFRSGDFESVHKAEVVYFRGNWDFINEFSERPRVGEMLPWLLQAPRPDIYRSILRMLLRHTDSVKSSIEDFFTRKVHNNKLVCAHVRQGRSKTLPTDDSTDIKEKDVQLIFDFLSKYKTSNHKLFIATDSADVKNLARQKFQDFLLEVPGPITHMDISRSGDLCNGQQKAFIEHEILTRCDTLLLTRSGFGIIAAFLRENSKELYCYSRHYIAPCSRYTLSKIYPWTLSPWDDL